MNAAARYRCREWAIQVFDEFGEDVDDGKGFVCRLFSIHAIAPAAPLETICPRPRVREGPELTTSG
ncbi:hypothetical protein HK102_008607, partial [Quaeritorhiza haematococci]